MNLLLRFARRSPGLVGSPLAFVLATASVVLWLAVGPFLDFSEAGLVFPATATSIGAFLIVFLIQFSQNRDMAVVQLKLDELIRSLGMHGRTSSDSSISRTNSSRLWRRSSRGSDSNTVECFETPEYPERCSTPANRLGDGSPALPSL